MIQTCQNCNRPLTFRRVYYGGQDHYIVQRYHIKDKIVCHCCYSKYCRWGRFKAKHQYKTPPKRRVINRKYAQFWRKRVDYSRLYKKKTDTIKYDSVDNVWKIIGYKPG